MGQGWASLGTLLAGMAVWGGVGWLIDTWLGLHVFLPVGVLVGLAASVYLVYVSSGGSSTLPASQPVPKDPRRSSPRSSGPTIFEGSEQP